MSLLQNGSLLKFGGHMKLTTLWNYIDDNSSIIKYDTQQDYTLRDSIDNYDEISIEFVSIKSDIGNWKGTTFTSVIVKELENALYPYSFSYTSFDSRSARFELKNNKIKCIQSNESNTNGIVNVYGIKY